MGLKHDLFEQVVKILLDGQGNAKRNHNVEQVVGAALLILDPLEIVNLQIAQTLFEKAGSNTSFEQHRVEGLEQIIIRPQLNSAHNVSHVGENREHDDRNALEGRVSLERSKHPVTIEIGHNQIEQHQIEGAGV